MNLTDVVSLTVIEWQLIDLALAAYSKVGVALYSTLGRNSVGKSRLSELSATADIAFQNTCMLLNHPSLHFLTLLSINHSEITMVFVAASNMGAFLALAPNCPKLRVAVSIEALTQKRFDEIEKKLKPYSVRLMTLPGRTLFIFFISPASLTHCIAVESLGKLKPLPPIPPTPDTIATICYTSGTTSKPKGVVLTHWNLTSSAIAFSQGFTFANDETNVPMLSYLPLAHMVGRVIEFTAFLLGSRIGYYSGDPLRLTEDAQILKPVIFPAVPRILNRIAGRIQAVKAESGLKGPVSSSFWRIYSPEIGIIVRMALGTKVARIERDGYLHDWLWDFLLFNRVSEHVHDLGLTNPIHSVG